MMRNMYDDKIKESYLILFSFNFGIIIATILVRTVYSTGNYDFM